jgi:hypothetical protein
VLRWATWHAVTALIALDDNLSEQDQASYRGKVTAARFFARNVLPRLSAERRRMIETVDPVMDVSEEAS